jgi:elongation factor Ts
MANITAQLVKTLREQTGVGMMDCKAALSETDGDLTAAVDWLRAKGLSKAAKKAGRVAAEGLVVAVVDGPVGALAEINAETDFVARNEQFQEMVRTVGKIALAHKGDVEHIAEMVGTIGENMTLRRAAALSVSHGAVAAYVHNAVSDGLGRIGVIVALESAGDPQKLSALGRQIAMHVAAATPLSVGVDDLDPGVVAREKAILVEQARESGRPENIIEKMVEGRMRKFHEESVLLEQTFVIDGERRVAKVIEDAAKELGKPIALAGFVRMALGEGVEREESDFAAEVAAAAAGS